MESLCDVSSITTESVATVSPILPILSPIWPMLYVISGIINSLETRNRLIARPISDNVVRVSSLSERHLKKNTE